MAIEVRRVITATEREAAFAIRRRVFIDEQKVPADEEYDAEDDAAVHVLALVDGAPAGTGRLLLYDGWGRIGRMAVELAHRRSGVGRAILAELIRVAEDLGIHELQLHAQTHALPFYEASGFVAFGVEFEEAGIPHRRMRRG